MNNEKILNLTIQKSPFVPDDYFERTREVREQELAIELFNTVKGGEYFTVKVERTSPYSFYLTEHPYSEPVPTYYETKVYIGKVKPVEYRYVPPKKLNLKERFIALFTGNIPYIMRQSE